MTKHSFVLMYKTVFLAIKFGSSAIIFSTLIWLQSYESLFVGTVCSHSTCYGGNN